jgi:hypothetical protein
VRLGPSTPGDYVRARVLVPLKSGCDRRRRGRTVGTAWTNGGHGVDGRRALFFAMAATSSLRGWRALFFAGGRGAGEPRAAARSGEGALATCGGAVHAGGRVPRGGAWRAGGRGRRCGEGGRAGADGGATMEGGRARAAARRVESGRTRAALRRGRAGGRGRRRGDGGRAAALGRARERRCAEAEADD